jgi:hypothetical protein
VGPKKRLLLYCKDEGRNSEVAFVLRTRGDRAGHRAGFEVVQVDRMVHLEHTLDFSLPFAGAVVLDSGEDSRGEDAVAAIHGHGGGVPVLLQPYRMRTAITMAEWLLAPGCPMEDLVEAARVLCGRKRGPKKPGAKAELALPVPMGLAASSTAWRKAPVVA